MNETPIPETSPANPPATTPPLSASAAPQSASKMNFPMLGAVAGAAAVVTFLIQVTVLKPKPPPPRVVAPGQMNRPFQPGGHPNFPMRPRPGFPPQGFRPGMPPPGATPPPGAPGMPMRAPMPVPLAPAPGAAPVPAPAPAGQ